MDDTLMLVRPMRPMAMPRFPMLLWIAGATLLVGILAAFLAISNILPCSHPMALIFPPAERTDRNRDAQLFDDLTITRDIVYGGGDRHRLDIYELSATDSSMKGSLKPVVVFIYGGSWASGSKADVAWVGASLARRGYMVIIPDYRIYPYARWPVFLLDNASAVRWARDHARSYGGDPASLVLMGHSAGAFEVASLAVDRRWLTSVGMEPQRDLLAVIGISGPYNLLPRSCRMKWIFGSPRQWSDARPINHADGKSPPILLLTGGRDDTASPQDSDQLATKIRANGGSASVIHYPSLDHMGILDAFTPLRGKYSPVLSDVHQFITTRPHM